MFSNLISYYVLYCIVTLLFVLTILVPTYLKRSRIFLLIINVFTIMMPLPSYLLLRRVLYYCHSQHSEDITNEDIRAQLLEHVIRPVVPAEYLDDKTIYHLNPSGRFVIGGPHGDAGLTG